MADFLFKYIDAVGENCVNNMLPKWENRLGGAQQFMSTHCFTMAQSGRIDPTVTGITPKQYVCIQISKRTPGNFFFCLKILLCCYKPYECHSF